MMEQQKLLDYEGLKHLVAKIKTGLNGKADLGDDGKIADGQIPDDLNSVLDFGGTVTGITVTEKSTERTDGTAVYVSDTKTFAYKVAEEGSEEPVYYKEWSKRKLYADEDGIPYKGKIYVDITERKIYHWTDDGLVELNVSLVLGETSTTAFAGDRGVTLESDMTAVKAKLPGKADLGGDGKVLSSQLPSYVSEAFEFTGILDGITVHPATTTMTTGYVVFDNTKKTFVYAVQEEEASDVDYYDNWPTRSSYEDDNAVPFKDKIYVDTTTKKSYRWSGSDLVEISASLVLGETASTAFPGDRGVALETDMASVKKSLPAKAEQSALDAAKTELYTTITTAAETEAAERKATDTELKDRLDALDKFAVMTEDEYDALETKDENTYYMLTED